MLIDGLKLMVIGMGAVFVFLTLMVLLISGSARLLAPFAARFELASDGGRSVRRQPARAPVVAPTAATLVPAIVAAVHQYRRDHEE